MIIRFKLLLIFSFMHTIANERPLFLQNLKSHPFSCLTMNFGVHGNTGMDRNGPSFVRQFMFLMKFWSFPDFHMKLLVLGKTLKRQFRSVPVFPYSNFGTFQLTSCSFNYSFVRHSVFLMKF